MAATTIVQDILDAAFATSTKNQPGTIATSGVELTEVVKRKLQGIYAFAARVNPLHFADTLDVTGVGGVWERPEAANAIIRIETRAFVEVVVVPFDARLAAELVPSVYDVAGGSTLRLCQSNPPGDTVSLPP